MKKGHNKSEVEAKISAKAWKDPEFKEKLLEDPRSALKELGFDPSSRFKVRVIEEDENEITYILQRPPSNIKEMTDAEMIKVAAGKAQSDTVWDCYTPGAKKR